MAGIGIGYGIGLDNSGAAGIVETSFNIVVKTDNPGTSTNTQFTLPLDGSSTYNFDIDWGDGNSETIVTNTPFTHEYGVTGTFNIKIGGVNNTFPALRFADGGDKEKLLFISNWGSIAWLSMQDAFFGCENLLVTASDIPDVSAVTDFSAMYDFCDSLTSVTLVGWDMSSATTIIRMFRSCISLTSLDMTGCDLSNITSFKRFIQNSSLLTSIIGWNTITVPTALTDMDDFADGATLYNENVTNLDWSSVTTAADCFNGSSFDTTNYDLLLVHLDSLSLQSNVPFHAGDACYSAGGPEASRDNLITQEFWTFTDGGPCNNANFWEGTIDAVYSTGGNWSLGTVPDSTEVALFIGDFNNPCDIDVNADVEGIEMQLGYTSTVTQLSGNTLDVGVASIYLDDGNFVGGDSAINNAGYHANHGASFTSTSDIYTLTAGNFIHTSGTFTHNSGQVIFTGNTQQINAAGVVFNRVKNSNSNAASSFIIQESMSVVTEYFHDRGTLRIADNKIVTLQGDWVAGSDPRLSTANQGVVEFDGTGAQELYNDKAGGLARIPAIRVNKSAGTLTMFDQVQFSTTGNVVGIEHTQGAVAFDASFVSIKSIGNGYEINWPAATAPVIPLMEQDQSNPNTGMSLAADFECTAFSGVDGDVFFTGFNFDTVATFTHRGDLRGGTNDILTVGTTFDWADGSASGIVGQWFLNVAGNAVADNVTVQDCNANGGNTVFATNSTNNGNTDNWDFLNSLFTTEDLNQFTTEDLNPVYV